MPSGHRAELNSCTERQEVVKKSLGDLRRCAALLLVSHRRANQPSTHLLGSLSCQIKNVQVHTLHKTRDEANAQPQRFSHRARARPNPSRIGTHGDVNARLKSTDAARAGHDGGGGGQGAGGARLRLRGVVQPLLGRPAPPGPCKQRVRPVWRRQAAPPRPAACARGSRR